MFSELGRKIMKFALDSGCEDYSMLEKIGMYCEEKDLCEMEVGNELSSDKKFKKILEEDLIRHNYIKENVKTTKTIISDF